MTQIELIKNYSPECEESKNAIAILEKLQQQEARLTKEEILKYAHQIKPVMRGKGILGYSQKNDLFWIPSYPIHTESYSYINEKTLGKAEGLHEILRITTYHRYGGYYAFLRPSTDEAIQQCPKEIIDKVCAFEIISLHGDNAELVYNRMLDRHVLTTIYYGGELPKEIAEQEVKW